MRLHPSFVSTQTKADAAVIEEKIAAKPSADIFKKNM
jgi:hypothetical protein